MNSHFEKCLEPGIRERIAATTRLSGWLSSRVIAVSGAVKMELLSLGLPEKKILIRLNPRRLGPPNPTFQRDKIREQLGYSAENILIVTIGHAVPVKAWDVLIAAFRRVSDAVPAARLILVGGITRADEQPVAAALAAQVRQLGIEGRVKFTGHVEGIDDILRASDIFVFPSRSEGFGQALIEALEAGLPCVATRVGIAEDVIVDGVNGKLVERNNEGALAESLIMLAADPALRERMQTNSFVPDIVPDQDKYARMLANDFIYLSSFID